MPSVENAIHKQPEESDKPNRALERSTTEDTESTEKKAPSLWPLCSLWLKFGWFFNHVWYI